MDVRLLSLDDSTQQQQMDSPPQLNAETDT